MKERVLKMANINQLYAVLNAVASQSLGQSAVTVTDTSSMVALGNEVLSSDTNVDAFTGALVDRIGRTIVSIRTWDAPQRDPLVKKPFEYGTILQKIYVDIEDSKVNNAWEIGSNNYTPSYAPVNKPDVRQKLFNKINTWEFDYTIPDNILRTAFTDEQTMTAFIDAIFVAMDNSLSLSVRDANNLTRATAIAHTINGGGTNAINLLAEYNDTASTQATVANCLYNTDFLLFATKRILDVNRYIKDLSRAWNNENFARHTSEDVKVLTMLQTFDSASATYLKASTFHDELLALGTNYNTVSFWQGAGTAYAFDDISKVAITLPAVGENDPVSVVQTGVLAVLHDIESIGTTIDNRRMTTERNNKDEYTNYYSKANIGYFYDGSENFVVFYVDAE